MKRKLFLGFIIVSILVLVIFLFAWRHYERILFENHFLEIMEQLNSTESRADVMSWFDAKFNFTELYDWVHEKLEFVPFNETFERHTDPYEILDSGKGRCEEFSILYVAACSAHDYQSRLVVSIDISNPIILGGLHVWAEVELNTSWVHVDPSGKIWNEPYMYEDWDWGKDVGSTVKIYAFEEGKCEDVTLDYKR